MQPKSNEFQEYEFASEEEELRGRIFSVDHIAMLHNERARIARELLNLNGTRKDYDAYLERDIYLKGQLHIINFLLDAHNLALAQQAELNSTQGM